MFRRFLQIVKNQPHFFNKKYIIATSGGADSMALLALFNKLHHYLLQSEHGLQQFEFIIAHCNYHLRGDESNKDEQLVIDFATKHNISCYVKEFDTLAILQDEGGNLENVARNLRYTWFEELRIQMNFDLIVTAHHKEDSVETMLINLFKGTGIAGVHGILPIQGRIFRPLLSFTKEELMGYNQENEVLWRDDHTNFENEYLRNHIRNVLLPQIKELIPNVMGNLFENTQRFQEVEYLYNEQIIKFKKRLIQIKGKEVYISTKLLAKQKAIKSLLWEILKEYNFSSKQITDVYPLINAISGHYVDSATHRILKDRDALIIIALQPIDNEIWPIELPSNWSDNKLTIVKPEGTLCFSVVDRPALFPSDNLVQFFSFKEIESPFILRRPQIGAYFYPLGMKGKKKKISKFLTDLKVPLHKKEQQWILESNKKVVTLVGQRLDERFAISPHEEKVIKLVFIPKVD